ncbi:MAG: replicative DNA helicase [Armatimonadetes bacterium]|nr:replicative DNA helicase [Armatimonadota bacterium]
MQTLERLPPQNIEAEQSTLGAMLIDPNAVSKVVEFFSSSDFYKEAHQIIFNVIFHLYEKGEPIDLITLSEELKRINKLEEIGGASYLTTLINVVPTSANVEYYSKIVKEKAELRNLVYAGTNIAQMGYEANESVEYLIDKSEQLIFNIARRRIGKDFLNLKDILTGAFEKIEELYARKAHITGVPSGFKEFDTYTAGFQPSEFIVIAARPSMGKTAFCLNVAQYVAIYEKLPVAVFSLEMSKDQLVQRLICSEAGVNAQKLRTGRLEDADWPNITRAMAVLSEAPIFIDDTPGLTVLEMRSKARKLKIKYGGLALLIIDYLQLIRSSYRIENRNQEISEISRQIKNLSKELNIPVIALSQLSREVEKRGDKRPQLSDLRESGAIEQEADLVAFIYREEYYNPTTPQKNIAEIIISKQRNGPTASVELGFLKEYTKFVELSHRRE